jgi:uncharacterized protein (TIGR01244 family)
MKGPVFAFLAVAAVACSLHVMPAGAEVEKTEMHGITNFSKVEETSGFAGPLVGFGGATGPSAMPGLKSAGFATVINLRLGTEEGVDIGDNRAAAEAAGLRYISLPLDTSHPDRAVVAEFLATVGNKANQPVYIHCNSATRAAALWMIGRVLEDGWDIEKASREVEIIATKPPAAIAFATGYLASQNNPEPSPE